jgi:flagellar biosynthetic protein FlhB
MVPGGWVIAPELEPKLERLSPAKNLGRLFAQACFEFGLSIAKAAVLGGAVHVSRSSVTHVHCS